MSTSAARRPGRPRIHPPKLKLRVDEICAHPLVRSNLTEYQQMVLSPAYDPPEVVSRVDEPPHLTRSQRAHNKLLRQQGRQRRAERAQVRRIAQRIAHSLFNQGLLTNAPVAPMPTVPGALPPSQRPPRILTIEDHNRRVTERALAHAITDVALNNERMARVSAHASRRAARTAGRSTP